LISFHAPPDDRGMIEVGFGIDVEYQNQGYGTEALAAMFDFAAREPEVQVLRYTVSASNIPSMKVITKFGFRHVGQQIDEEDGPEEIFEISAKEYLAKS
jgi:[ribosomal protein S5]-alanine N-acetyltransferase